MKACFQIAECSLFYVKTVQARAMKACFQIAECSLFYSKTVQARAMKACFQIAERSLFYVKTVPASAMRPCFQIALFGQACIKKGCGAGPFRLTFHSIRNVPVCAFPCSAVL